MATAARERVSMKQLLAAVAAIALGLFYWFLHHDVHIASGIGFGLSHIEHMALGNILATAAVVALAVFLWKDGEYVKKSR